MPQIKKVNRFDFRKIEKARKTDNGFLIAPVKATRSGVFTYRTADGGILKEYRPDEEVFNSDSMGSLAFVPVTNRHPKRGLLKPSTAKKDAVGSVGENIEKSGSFLKAVLSVFDEEAINDIENNGIQEVSCGYTADLEFTPGIAPDGEKYDAIQRNIRYNHIALVRRGRAGPEARLKLDDASAILDDGEIEIDDLYFDDKDKNKYKDKKPKEGNMPKIKLDGMEFEVESALAGAIKAEIKDQSAEAVKKAMKEKDQEMAEKKKKDKEKQDEMQAKLDAANEELEKAKGEKLDDKQIHAMAKERSALLDSASKFVSKETKLDEMTNLEIKTEVVKQNCKVDEAQLESEVYVQARFDAVMESKPKKDRKDPVRTTMKDKIEKEDEGELTADQIRDKRMREDSLRWQQPLNQKQ